MNKLLAIDGHFMGSKLVRRGTNPILKMPIPLSSEWYSVVDTKTDAPFESVQYIYQEVRYDTEESRFLKGYWTSEPIGSEKSQTAYLKEQLTIMFTKGMI